ncbi:hypothetical protein CFP56_019894 [Quercus suber]|uniref:Uncharacterized protein n=1 Tax=Quercus suber TaxID=58331 RepID=A0AAW0KG78_QUESU
MHRRQHRYGLSVLRDSGMNRESRKDWISGCISFHRRKRRRTQPALTQRENIENVRIREYQRQSESESSYSERREKEHEKKKSHGTELLFCVLRA